MGKHREVGALWDDSALIRAFDDAISDYKSMHGLDFKHSNDATAAQSGDELMEKDGETTVGADNFVGEKELGEICLENESAGEEQFPGPVEEESVVNSSNVPLVYPQTTEHYNMLLAEYYELEEKKQSILQQMYQYGGYSQESNCKSYGYESAGTCIASQSNMIPSNHASLPSGFCLCCSCARHCSTTTCDVPGCSGVETCANMQCSQYCHDGAPSLANDAYKAAMESAETAISSIMLKTSSSSQRTEKKLNDESEVEIAPTSNPETGLSAVLKAWFSAGFITGKYLAEQSAAKK